MDGITQTISKIQTMFGKNYPSKVLTATSFISESNWYDSTLCYIPDWLREFKRTHPDSVFHPNAAKQYEKIPLFLHFE